MICEYQFLVSLLLSLYLSGCSNLKIQEEPKSVIQNSEDEAKVIPDAPAPNPQLSDNPIEKDRNPKQAESDNSPSHVLMLQFHKPRKQYANSFQQITGKTIYCSKTAADKSDGDGYSYVLVNPDELEEIFGLKMQTRTIVGAGNNSDADASFTKIIIKQNLNQSLKPLLKSFDLQNDPKFELWDDASPEGCADFYK